MSERKKAIEAGEKLFRSDKPCKYGHMGDRYTSTGGCVECMKQKQKDFQTAFRQTKAKINTLATKGIHPFPVYVRPSQQHDVSAYCDVLRYGSPEIIEQCNAFVALMREQAIATFGK